MKKRLQRSGILLLAAGLLALSLGGCVQRLDEVQTQGRPSAAEPSVAEPAPLSQEECWERLTAAVGKMAALDAMDCSMNMNMSIDTGESTLEVRISADMKIKDPLTDPLASGTLVYDLSELMGLNMTADFYYAGGKMYLRIGQSKICTEQELDQGVGDVSARSDLPPREAVSSLSSERQEGRTIATLKLDPEKAQEYLEEQIASSGGEDTFSLSDYAIGEATMVIGWEDDSGYVTSIQTDIQMEAAESIRPMEAMEAEKEGSSCRMRISVEYHQPGEPVIIIPPDDLNSYQNIEGDSPLLAV